MPPQNKHLHSILSLPLPYTSKPCCTNPSRTVPFPACQTPSCRTSPVLSTPILPYLSRHYLTKHRRASPADLASPYPSFQDMPFLPRISTTRSTQPNRSEFCRTTPGLPCRTSPIRTGPSPYQPCLPCLSGLFRTKPDPCVPCHAPQRPAQPALPIR